MKQTIVIETSERGKMHLYDLIEIKELSYLRLIDCLEIKGGYALYLKRLNFSHQTTQSLILLKAKLVLLGLNKFEYLNN